MKTILKENIILVLLVIMHLYTCMFVNAGNIYKQESSLQTKVHRIAVGPFSHIPPWTGSLITSQQKSLTVLSGLLNTILISSD